MNLQKKVKDILKKINDSKPVPNSAYGAYLHERDIKFGDPHSLDEMGHPRQDVCYLLRKFPPCRMYKHKDSCTGYMPTNKRQEKWGEKTKITLVNPVMMWCDGLDSYTYTLVWYTRLNKTFYKVKVIINYGHELVTIKYNYNDRRSLPKYSDFKASSITGLKAIMYYGDSGEHMTKYAVEVIDKYDTEFFITQGE